MREWLRANGASGSLTAADVDPATVESVSSLMPLLPQRKAETLIAAVNDAWLRIAMTTNSEALTAQALPIEQSLEELTTLSHALPEVLPLHMEAYLGGLLPVWSG